MYCAKGTPEARSITSPATAYPTLLYAYDSPGVRVMTCDSSDRVTASSPSLSDAYRRYIEPDRVGRPAV